MRVLLLGGTAEAARLAEELAARGVTAVTSLAGAVARTRIPVGESRIGGFGGEAGLAEYLRAQRFDAVVDATHPFAARISANAAAACAGVDVPLLRLSRPSWSDRPDAGSWHWVSSADEACELAPRLGERVFLAIGRKGLAVFSGWTDVPVVVRVVDPPDFEVPSNWVVLRSRGPFSLEAELDLLTEYGVDVMVSKDSGGPTQAKLNAAARLGVAVVMIRRPPDAPGVPVVRTVEDAVTWTESVQ